MPNALEVNKLAVSFGAVSVLKDVTFAIAPGEVIGLIGSNGAGKTTTLRAISGTVRPNKGRIAVGDESMIGKPQKSARAGIVHVPEGRGLFTQLTVRQNLRLGAVAVGRDLGLNDIPSILAIFPKLEALLDTRSGYLSGGEQQMVTIARGLLAGPKVLMVDELSLGLAPRIISEILAALLAESRARNTALLIVDQNVRGLAEVCDRILLLHKGVTSDATNDVEQIARDAYLGTNSSSTHL